ncbi:hypothetical protein CYFUS_000472 [Cystobacter fuscus]|uniref:Type IV secretion protein Rhs n=1 Tax=Cystobacter fuscus TaxID=43 RepID=A0A250IUZ6_9BACT|nr:DUF6531 domain-containing protein [Cystobacter fuscus]ATB35060.1 hypothetical protein CYFUS_000472 [Cystobacter fuscus]
MLQSSYFDPVLGLDIHIVLMPTPAGPVPTPIPQPFVGLVFDPVGLAMGAAMGMALGSGPGLVLVNNLPVTNAGTAVTNLLTLPHLPVPGVAFAKGKPGNDAELFFGSLNVSLGGSLGVRLGDIALSCSDPVRLPTSLVLAIPKGPPVLNNPAMVPDMEGIAQRLLMAAGMKALKAAARGGARLFRTLRAAQRKSRGWSKVSGALRNVVDRIAPQRYRDRLKRVVCFVTGHPVDVATGRVFTDHIDFELPGPLPLVFERVYSSSLSWRNGSLGYGWSHSLDQSVWVERGKVIYLAEDGREVEFHTDALPGYFLPAGQSLFDATNRLTLRALGSSHWEIEMADGRVLSFTPVPSSLSHRAKLTRIRSRDGHHDIRLAYDERGLLDMVRDSADRLIGFVHDTKGRLTEVKLPLSRESGWYRYMRYVYDEHGDLMQVVDALGRSWAFEYQNHLMVQEKDRNGLSFYFQYDSIGPSARCVRTWGDGGIFDHLITYDTRNRKTLVEDSLGCTTLYELDELGMVVKVTDANGASTEYAYDATSGQLAEEKDSLGHTRATTYDSRGNALTLKGPDGVTVYLEYEARGLLVRAMDALGGVWTWAYDAEGHLVERRMPTGEKKSWGWKQGLLAWVEDSGGRRTTFEYDRQKNMSFTRASNGAVTEYEHDGLGRPVRVRDSRGGTLRCRYDALGRLLRLESPSGVLQESAYDAEGNLLEARDATRHVKLRYGHFHKMIAREEAGTSVRFTYDTEGRLTGVINEVDEAYTFTLDACGRVVEEMGFDGGVQRYERDSSGRVTKKYMPSGRTTALTYDAAGRVVKAAHSDGTCVELEYQANGALVRAKNESAVVMFERDALGRIVREIQGDFSVSSRFGIDGERALLETSLGGCMAVLRDALGHVSALHVGEESLHWVQPTVRFERDTMGMETARVLPGGVRIDWQRDMAGRPTHRRTVRRGGNDTDHPLDTRSYQWRGEDQIAAILDSVRGSTFYQHDQRGRLIAQETTGGVLHRAMDYVGNIHRSAAFDDRRYGRGGRLLEMDGTLYTHDEDGYWKEKVEEDGSRWGYLWNGAGLLSRVIRPDGSHIRFEYDAFARCTRRALVRSRDDGTDVMEEDTRFVWDGQFLVHEVPAHTAPITWYWEPGGFSPIAREQAQQLWTIASDHLGVPTEMYSERGDLVWRMQLNVYGQPSFERGTARDCPWRWPGQYEDEGARLTYNRHRFFDSQSGMYCSPDPIRLAGGTEFYAYCPDPLLEIDPLGLVRIHTEGPVAVNAYPGPLAGGVEHSPLHAHLNEGKFETRVLMEDYYKKGKLVGSAGDVYPGDPDMTKNMKKVVKKNLDELKMKTRSVFETGKC